jgi:hypothetical protein
MVFPLLLIPQREEITLVLERGAVHLWKAPQVALEKGLELRVRLWVERD